MIAPLALIGFVGLPVIVAFYMLRLRRRDVPVGSTFLWEQLVRDVEANAPWQRLRFSWLLLVQLLIAALVVAAAVRPFTSAPSDLAANVVLVMDTSASMAATEADGDRLGAARDRARAVVDRLPDGGRITVVAAADSARVLVSETDDRDAALDAIDAVEATQLPGDLTDAFALASALAARDADSTVVVVTDASGDRLPGVGVGARIVVELVGTTDGNQAIAALSALRRSGGAQLDVFVAVANPSAADVTRRLELYADGTLVDARDLAIPARQRSEAIIGAVPAATTVVEARLAGDDALAADDRAFAIVPAETTTRTLLVGEGNPYLENALALLPRLELFAVGAAGYEDALEEAAEAGTPYGLLVFDGVVPDDPPAQPALYLDPGEDGAFGAVAGRIDGPALDAVSGDEPLLRFVDLSTVHVGRARAIELADGMRPIVATRRGSPLIAVGRAEGRPMAVIGFDLGESDLPLQVAFPLLMSNLVDFLVPVDAGLLPSATALGESFTARVDPRIRAVQVRPVAGETGMPTEIEVLGGQVTIPGAQSIGIRELWAVSDDPDLDGTSLGSTAVNLFRPDESDVAPGDPQRIADMGRVPPAGERPETTARAEWWWPFALVALALLAVEWLLFHRPTRRALGRWARGLGRGSAHAAGGPAR